MRFISLDLENNQPSGEIIQIGAVAFDTDDDTPLDEFQHFVNPGEPINWNHELRPEKEIGCTLGELLPFDQNEFNAYKRDPKEVLEEFWAWVKKAQCGKKIIQWGSGDLDCLIKASKKHGVRYPHQLRSINLKTFYQFVYQPAMRLPKGYGLGTVVKNTTGSFYGEPHDAYWDAYNTGKVLIYLFRRMEKLGQIEKIMS